MTKGIFLLSFMNMDIESTLTKKEMIQLAKKVKPIIKKFDCDMIITNRSLEPIHKDNLIIYLQQLLDEVRSMK